MTTSYNKINMSGELFDLSVPTWNNEFGHEHILYITYKFYDYTI